MDRGQAKLMRSKHLRVVKGKMENVREQISDAYERNRGEIDERITKVVLSICVVQPVNPEYLTKTFHHVIDSIFYKRPSKNVIHFLDDICVYPPEVVYESVMSYSMHMIEHGKRKKSSAKYFLGFLRRSFFNYKNENKVNLNSRNELEDLPDDL